jgi:hypothetical protein
MTPEEALALLNFNQEDPLDEQFELLFFELKQKIYRQLDQVLLYPKWIKELTRLDNAARAIGFGFTEEDLSFYLESKVVSYSNDRSILAQFNEQHQLRSKIAFLIYNGKSPRMLKELLEFWLAQQKNFFEVWAGAHLPKHEILLSKQFDPQQILSLLTDLDKAEIKFLEDLSEENTPLVLQHFIAWNKAVWTKLNNT